MTSRAPSARLGVHGSLAARYQVLGEIASGGMAAVHVARPVRVAARGQLLAIKRCHQHLRDDDDFVSMFYDEALLASRLRHPNIVATVDVGEPREMYLVMEYIEGERVSGLVRAAARRGQTVPPAIAARIAIDVLSGLHCAHELAGDDGAALHVVHRDVSPQNILVGVDGVTKITDFGIAKAASRSSVTRIGVVKGKLSYMAPEQFDGDRVTRRADVFAAGIVLWEVLTGQRLFHGESDAAIVEKLMNSEIAPPSRVCAAVPTSLDAVVLRALERDPLARYATAAEFAQALGTSGAPVAPAREVAAFIEQTLGPVLAARRRAIAALCDAADAQEAQEAQASPAPGPVLVPTASDGAFVRVWAEAARPSPAREPVAPAASSRLASMLAFALGVAACVGLAAGVREGLPVVRELAREPTIAVARPAAAPAAGTPRTSAASAAGAEGQQAAGDDIAAPVVSQPIVPRVSSGAEREHARESAGARATRRERPASHRSRRHGPNGL